MRVRGLMDGCCCNGVMGLRLRMAAVAMDAQNTQTSTRALGRRYVSEAMESHQRIIIIVERGRIIALPASMRQTDARCSGFMHY